MAFLKRLLLINRRKERGLVARTPSALHFDSNNLIEFLNDFEEMCEEYNIDKRL